MTRSRWKINAGEVHVLLGENGAGKSTLIAMLAGMQQPDEGEIRVAGRPVKIGSPRESLDLGIGTVFQHMLLVPSLSVIENLMLGGPWVAALGAPSGPWCASKSCATFLASLWIPTASLDASPSASSSRSRSCGRCGAAARC